MAYPYGKIIPLCHNPELLSVRLKSWFPEYKRDRISWTILDFEFFGGLPEDAIIGQHLSWSNFVQWYDL